MEKQKTFYNGREVEDVHFFKRGSEIPQDILNTNPLKGETSWYRPLFRCGYVGELDGKVYAFKNLVMVIGKEKTTWEVRKWLDIPKK